MKNRLQKRDVRRRRRHSAWISTDGKPAECQVVDVSEGGAKLVIANIAIPPSFEIAMVPNSTRLERCDVAWQRGRMVGVKYIR